MAGKGGGAWKVAYADFVTAMMAFFMVMWLVGQKEDVKEAIAHYFQDPTGEMEEMDGSTQGAPTPPPGRGHGGKPKQDSPSKDPHDEESKKPRTLVIHTGAQTAVGAIVVFADDATNLDEEGKREINRILPKLAGMPQKIEVRGHASRRGLKSTEDESATWRLCYERSMAVLAYLQEQGIEPNRIRLTQAGVYEPFTIRNDADVQIRNSRVEVFLLAEIAEDLVGTPEERSMRFQEEVPKSGDEEQPEAKSSTN
jgi:chemotaxis protein MotB